MTEGQLYDPVDRMKFIGSIANTYHYLMLNEKKQTESIIETISTWCDNA